jgi:NADH:ubiquinone oxidoreductase subunit K
MNALRQHALDDEKIEAEMEYRYLPESYGQWVAISVILASFGSFFGTGVVGERKVGTLLISISIGFLLWSSPIYFITRWNRYNKLMLASFAILILALIAAFLYLAVLIWKTPNNTNKL